MIRERLEQASESIERGVLYGLCKDYGNYNKVKRYLDVNDFTTPEFRDVYLSIKSLYDNSGFKNITLSSVDSYSIDKGLDSDKMIRLKSFVELGKDIEVDFDGTYNQFRRTSGMYRFLQNADKFGGVENFLLDMYNKTETAEQLKNELDTINKLCFKSYKSAVKVTSLASGMVEYVKERMFKKDGRSIDFLKKPVLQSYSKGIHVGVTFILANSGKGKALPMDSKLYMRDKEVLMKDIKIGDEIFGEDGNLHKVIGVYPQGKKQKVRVHFSDKTFVDCCEDHLWEVKTDGDRPKKIKIAKGNTVHEIESAWKTRTMSVKEIVEKGVIRKSKGGTESTRFRIPVTKPVNFDKREHIIDPYLLGVLIGDGYLCGNSVVFSTSEDYIIEKVKSIIGGDYLVKKHKGNNYSYNIVSKNPNINPIKREINRLGLNVKSHDKFVPEEYKFDSVENRLSLLRGIFDTDGNINVARKSVYTISDKLKDDIVWLAQSLGMLAIVTEDARDKYVGNDRCYKITLDTNEDMLPFTSPKHTNKYSKPKRYVYTRRYIKKIEYLDEYVEMQCIQVDNPTSLFLTDNFAVTHNTTTAIPWFSIPILENGQKLLSIHNEQEEDEIRQLYLMSYISQVKGNTKKIHRTFLHHDGLGKMSEEQMSFLIECAEEFEKRYEGRLEFVFIPRFNPDDLEQMILEYNRMGYDNVLLDTFKQEDSGDGWEGLDTLAKRVDGISKELGMKIICTAQLAPHTAWRKYLTVSCIGKAKSIKEVATSLYMFRWLAPEEIPTIKFSYYKKNEKTDKVEWVDNQELETHRKDSYGNLHPRSYIALFNDKQRKAEDGQVIIYEADLGGLYFKEIGITTSIKNDDNGR